MNFFTFILVGFLLSEVARDAKCLSNGKDADEGQFNYMVYIETDLGDCVSSCGGAIINTKHVLTAAHCARSNVPSQIKVIAGVTDFKNIPPGNQMIDVEKIKKHPLYVNPKKGKSIKQWIMGIFNRRFKTDSEVPELHDIAVFRLKTEIQMGDTAQQIPLSPANAPVPYKGHCVFAGWGQIAKEEDAPTAHHLQWSEMEILEPKYCTEFEVPHADSDFCVTHAVGTTFVQPLSGDSGGPFVCNGEVFGVAGTTNSRLPIATFSKVSDHLEFIKKAAKM